MQKYKYYQILLNQNHYDKLSRNYIFVPIAVETFGSWGPKGLKFIKEIGKEDSRKNRQ